VQLKILASRFDCGLNVELPMPDRKELLGRGPEGAEKAEMYGVCSLITDWECNSTRITLVGNEEGMLKAGTLMRLIGPPSVSHLGGQYVLSDLI
jgi:hypothetical protein